MCLNPGYLRIERGPEIRVRNEAWIKVAVSISVNRPTEMKRHSAKAATKEMATHNIDRLMSGVPQAGTRPAARLGDPAPGPAAGRTGCTALRPGRGLHHDRH